MGSRRTVRVGRSASTPSKKRISTPVACREKRLKLTPAAETVAPSGALDPRVPGTTVVLCIPPPPRAPTRGGPAPRGSVGACRTEGHRTLVVGRLCLVPSLVSLALAAGLTVSVVPPVVGQPAPAGEVVTAWHVTIARRCARWRPEVTHL